MDLCQVERRKVIEHYTINMYTGEKQKRLTSTEVEACDTPMFSDVERKRGVCNSCFEGWSVEGNMPTPRGYKQIQAARDGR